MSTPRKPLYLHRARFVDYNPSSITALAFSHPCTDANSKRAVPSTLRLAIGKTNGDIEIWRPLQHSSPRKEQKCSFFHETSMKGGKDRGIEGLAWTQDPFAEGGRLRLFSIGYSTAITEWNLATGKPKEHLECTGGAIWSIASQPVTPQTEGEYPLLAVGMEDGSVQLVSTNDGEMTYLRTCKGSGKKKSRVLSLAWQGREKVVAGMADSAIKVMDVRNGRTIERMSLGREITKGKEVLIWTLKCTTGGDIISGDSNGEVLVWNGKNYTLKQRLKSHAADILTLEVNAAGTVLFTAGIDMKTVIHQLVETDGRKRWGEVAHRRFHTHDVRAMAAYEGVDFSYVISGGVDMTPVMIPLRNFTAERFFRLPGLPQTPICATSPNQRLLLSHYEHEVKLWRISHLDEVFRADAEADLDDDSKGRELVSRIVLNNDENITTACMSNAYGDSAGNLIALGTLGALKLFYVRPSKTKVALRVSKVEVPSSFVVVPAKKEKKVVDEDDMEDDASDDEEVDSDDEEEVSFDEEGARLLKFSPDGKWLLVVTADSRAFMLELNVEIDDSLRANVTFSPRAIELPRAERTEQTKKQKVLKHEGTFDPAARHTIRTAEFNSDGSILALADISGWIDIYTQAQTWTHSSSSSSFPRLPAGAAALHFRPSSASPTNDNLLISISSPQCLLEFHALTGQLTPWSRRNPPERFPTEFMQQADVASGLLSEEDGATGKKRVWVWSINWLFMFDLSQDLQGDVGDEGILVPSVSRKRSAAGNLIWDEQAQKNKAEQLKMVLEEESDEEVKEEEGPGQQLVGRPEAEEEEEKAEPYWFTYKYKPLLGVLPIGTQTAQDGKESQALVKAQEGVGEEYRELVVIERPYWEVPTGPRYYGKQAWEHR